MFTTDLYVRLTHHFAPGWSDLDDDRHVGAARLTPWRLVRPPQDYDDGGVYTSTATVRTQDRRAARAIEQALADTLGGSRCRHEHDCCGCSYRRVEARRVGKHRYAVRMSVTFNY
jgi:hypothetical protein